MTQSKYKAKIATKSSWRKLIATNLAGIKPAETAARKLIASRESIAKKTELFLVVVIVLKAVILDYKLMWMSYIYIYIYMYVYIYIYISSSCYIVITSSNKTSCYCCQSTSIKF